MFLCKGFYKSWKVEGIIKGVYGGVRVFKVRIRVL